MIRASGSLLSYLELFLFEHLRHDQFSAGNRKIDLSHSPLLVESSRSQRTIDITSHNQTILFAGDDERLGVNVHRSCDTTYSNGYSKRNINEQMFTRREATEHFVFLERFDIFSSFGENRWHLEFRSATLDGFVLLLENAFEACRASSISVQLTSLSCLSVRYL